MTIVIRSLIKLFFIALLFLPFTNALSEGSPLTVLEGTGAGVPNGAPQQNISNAITPEQRNALKSIYNSGGDWKAALSAMLTKDKPDEYVDVDNPYGQGGFGQRNLNNNRIENYQLPKKDNYGDQYVPVQNPLGRGGAAMQNTTTGELKTISRQITTVDLSRLLIVIA